MMGSEMTISPLKLEFCSEKKEKKVFFIYFSKQAYVRSKSDEISRAGPMKLAERLRVPALPCIQLTTRFD